VSTPSQWNVDAMPMGCHWDINRPVPRCPYGISPASHACLHRRSAMPMTCQGAKFQLTQLRSHGHVSDIPLLSTPLLPASLGISLHVLLPEVLGNTLQDSQGARALRVREPQTPAPNSARGEGAEEAPPPDVAVDGALPGDCPGQTSQEGRSSITHHFKPLLKPKLPWLHGLTWKMPPV
jgi:hypothetical protein